MLVELYNVAMAGTMAVAGLLLTRDYVRFLKSTHQVNAVVKTIQHVFLPSNARSGTKSGYYPVLEYKTNQGPVAFTCIDERAANRFHIGDKVKLHVSKSRRTGTRNCRTFVLLSAMLAVLVGGLFLSALVPDSGIGSLHIIVASFVVATSLFVIVRFKRDQDESMEMQTFDCDGGNASYWLKEPTAFKHWCKALHDRKQAARVRLSQAFGFCCFVISGGIAAGALSPVLG